MVVIISGPERLVQGLLYKLLLAPGILEEVFPLGFVVVPEDPVGEHHHAVVVIRVESAHVVVIGSGAVVVHVRVVHFGSTVELELVGIDHVVLLRNVHVVVRELRNIVTDMRGSLLLVRNFLGVRRDVRDLGCAAIHAIFNLMSDKLHMDKEHTLNHRAQRDTHMRL